MKSWEFKFLIQECLGEILQKEGLIRACAYCDILNPPTDEQPRSHGYCREHSIRWVMDNLGFSQIEAVQWMKEKEKAGSTFPPNTSGAKETDELPKRG